MKKVGVAAALIVLCGTFLVSFLIFGPIRFDARYFFELLSAPETVQHMVFVEETDTGSSLVRIKFGGLEKKTFDGFRILQVVQSGNATVGLFENRTTGTIDVAHIEGGDLKPLTTDGVEKSGITLSPDGTHVAYALRSANTESSQSDETYNVADYETKVITLSGEDIISFEGNNHPFFWSDEILVTFSEKGIETHNLVSGEHTYITDTISPFLEERPVFGRNHTMIIRTSPSSELTVLEFATEPPLAYRVLNPIPSSDTGVGLSAERIMYLVTRRDGYGVVQSFIDLEQAPTTLLKLPSTFFNPSDVIFAYDN